MKKFSIRSILSAMLAFSIMSASVISSYATDYLKPPDNKTTADDKNSDGSDKEKNDGLSEDKPATLITDDTINELLKDGKDKAFMEEDSNGNATVSESAIGEIAKNDKPITINLDSKNGIDCSIEIDPKLIKTVKAINLAMNISVQEKRKNVSGVPVKAGSIVIDPAQKGDFGMVLKLTIPASALYNLVLNRTAVYYISDSGAISRMNGALTINNDGSASFPISHASAYVITDEDIADVREQDTKDSNTTTVTPFSTKDSNPMTGTTIAFGSLALFGAAAALTSRKRK